MNLTINIYPCARGSLLPLSAFPPPSSLPAHILTASPPFPEEALALRAGSFLVSQDGAISFQIAAISWLPYAAENGQATFRFCPILRACADVPERRAETFTIRHKGFSLASITLSDKGASGKREDLAGPLIAELMDKHIPLSFRASFLAPDEPGFLRSLLTSLALEQHFDIICTSGGTGVAPRDRTPEATLRVLDATLPGFSQAMLMASLKKTPNAIISRAAAGLIGQSLVINLPGSPRAVRENLEAILPALAHTLAKIHGDPADCGGE